MSGSLGTRQEALLRSLLKHTDGLAIEDLAVILNITRTAVRQHLTALGRDGYVARAAFRPTGGRPGQLYRLSERGRDLFPKRYSWFSGLLLDSVRGERGSDGLAAWLSSIADSVLPALESRVKARTVSGRIAETVALLAELGYEAEAKPGADPPTADAGDALHVDADTGSAVLDAKKAASATGPRGGFANPRPEIEATNCPYHDLARQFPEVCAFDLRLLESLIQTEISHDACMALGDNTCRFRSL